MGQNIINSEIPCSSRALILENGSLATQLKIPEQSFDMKMETLRMSLEKKLEKSEELEAGNICKHKENIYDKLYDKSSEPQPKLM